MVTRSRLGHAWALITYSLLPLFVPSSFAFGALSRVWCVGQTTTGTRRQPLLLASISCIFACLSKDVPSTMGKFAGYLTHLPQLRTWLEKYRAYSGDIAMGVNLRFLLKEHGMYGRLIWDIMPLEDQGEILFLLARVIQNNDMTPGLIIEEEHDKEAKRELLNRGGLEDKDLEWATCSIGY